MIGGLRSSTSGRAHSEFLPDPDSEVAPSYSGAFSMTWVKCSKDWTSFWAGDCLSTSACCSSWTADCWAFVFSRPLKQIIPVTAERTIIKIPSPTTIPVGNDFSFLATVEDSDSSVGSSTNWALSLVLPLPLQVYWSTFLSPGRQFAQVPNQVMILLESHESERQTLFPLWALVYGSHGVHLDLSVLKISLSPAHLAAPSCFLTHLVLL